jgi:hypothetical protein
MRQLATEYLTNYIVKTFEYGNNIGQALRELEYPNPDSCRPTMQQSTHPGNDPADEAQRAFKNKQFEIKFKSEFDDFHIRRQTLDNIKPEAYASCHIPIMPQSSKTQSNY